MKEETIRPLCHVAGCQNERELYADGDHDTLSNYCAFHGETEEGQKELAMPPQIKQAKLETLEAIIKEVEGMKGGNKYALSGDYEGGAMEALDDLLTKLNEQLTLLKNER